MTITTIAIGADHRGFALKKFLLMQKSIAGASVEWVDVGTHTAERTDYPPYAVAVAQAVLENNVDCGVLLCGNGIGVSIVANRFPGIYAGLAWAPTVAYMAKEHDNINVLVLPADYMNETRAITCLAVWLSASFKGGVYQERLAMIDELDICSSK